MIVEKLTQLITEVLASLELPEVDFVVEHPADELHGDYSTNVAMVIGKSEKKNPREVAEKILNMILEQSIEFIEKVEVVRPRFDDLLLDDGLGGLV